MLSGMKNRNLRAFFNQRAFSLHSRQRMKTNGLFSRRIRSNLDFLFNVLAILSTRQSLNVQKVDNGQKFKMDLIDYGTSQSSIQRSDRMNEKVFLQCKFYFHLKNKRKVRFKWIKNEPSKDGARVNLLLLRSVHHEDQ